MSDTKRLVILAWVVTLLLSALPDIIISEAVGPVPDWLFWAKAGFMAAALALCFLWKKVRALLPFVYILLVLHLAVGVVLRFRRADWWQEGFAGVLASYPVRELGVQLLDLAAALVLIVTLWALKGKASAFFLAKGRLDAPVEPVRWLGVRSGTKWTAFGLILTLVAGLATMTFLLLTAPPSGGMLARLLPLLPVVLLIAALNAFSEEVTFRATMLATSAEVIGRGQALLLSSVFFGLGHYDAVPGGIPMVLMTGFLAWLMGKSMLETRGMGWAWFIHFVQDVFIFAFIAAGSL